MFILKLKPSILVGVLLLAAQSGLAQSRTEPAKATGTAVTVRVELPSALTAIKDYAAILLSQDQDKLQALARRRKQRTQAPVMTFPVVVPKSWARKLQGEP